MYAERGETEMYETLVSDIQTGVVVNGNKITGTLKYLTEGAIAGYWGAGNFLALKFANPDPKATSIKVGLDPSQGSGLVELLGDPDFNCVAKITNKATQKFKIVTTDGTKTTTQLFDLSGLTLENS